MLMPREKNKTRHSTRNFILRATRVQAPDEIDLSKLDRILKFLKGSQGSGINLEIGYDVAINTFKDCSHDVHHDFNGQSGLALFVGSTLIDAKSSKQKSNRKS